MDARSAVKSILKQPSQKPKPTDEQKAKLERDRHHLKIALYHAYKIQDQKKVQVEILDRLEALIDLPSGTPFTAQEARHFTSAVQIFQHSDLDDLAEERCIEGRCGYVLCLRPSRSAKARSWQIVKGGANYCSDVCLKKMLYIKTQLSEVPAWEREPGDQPEIVLHDDDRIDAEIVEAAVASMSRKAQADDEELAFERGETRASFRPKQVMTEKIVEKAVTNGPSPDFISRARSHRAIEGYEPKHKVKKKTMISTFDEDDSEDD